MHECDILLLLGTDFPYKSFMPTAPKIVQIDVRAERLGRRSKLDLGLCGDIRDTLRGLLPLVETRVDRSFLDAMLEQHVAAGRKLRAYADRVSKHRPIHPEHVAAMLDELAGPAGGVHHRHRDVRRLGARYLRAAAGRRFLGSFNHGTMANARRRRSGAGGLPWLAGDLAVRRRRPGHAPGRDPDGRPARPAGQDRRLQLPPPRHGPAGAGGRRHAHYGCELKNPNFAALAEAVGLAGLRVEDPQGVRPALEQRSVKRPVLVDVLTDPNVLSLPPKVTIERAKGFALAMTRMAFTGELDDVTDTVMANWRYL